MSKEYDSMTELALNMQWSWNHATDKVREQIDPKLWEITHNPWLVLKWAVQKWPIFGFLMSRNLTKKNEPEWC
jgi:hypothetical protein